MKAGTGESKIVLEGLSKRYGTFTALEPISLTVEEGEFLTLLGPSGSGKTTLLQMISGLVDPTAGRLLVNGEDWTHRPVNQRGMGMVFQHYALFPHMTVAENVSFPLEMRKLPSRDVTAQVEETLRKVQLDSFAHRFPRELSGGQQQLGAPHQIYSDPETAFAAGFIGHSNVLKGTRQAIEGASAVINTANGTFTGRYTARDQATTEVALVIRPEQMRLGQAPSSEFEGVRGRLTDLVYLGSERRLLITLGDGETIMLRHDPSAGSLPSIGAEVATHWPKALARGVA